MGDNHAPVAALQPPWEQDKPKPGFVYSTRQVVMGSWLGGPFAAAWFLGSNARQFGRATEQRRIWLYACVTVALLIPLAMWVPTTTPNALIPAIYCSAVYFFANATQKRDIERYLAEARPKSSHWRVAGVGLAHMALLGALFIGAAYVVPIDSWNTVVAGKSEFIYERGVTREDARRLAEAARKAGFIGDDTELSFTLARNVGSVTIGIPFQSGAAADAELVKSLSDFREFVSAEVFPHEQIVVVMENALGVTQKRIDGRDLTKVSP